MSELSWTEFQPAGGLKSQAHRTNVTWLELTIAFQYETGYSIVGSAATLDEQVSCFRAALSKLLTKADIKKTANVNPPIVRPSNQGSEY